MASKIGSLIIDIKANTQKLVESMNKSKKIVDNAASSMNKALKAIGFAAAGLGLKSLIATGIEYNKQIEDTQQTIKSLIIATSSMEDSNGKALTAQQLFTLAQKEAIVTTEKLVALNSKTALSQEQTNKLYATLLPSMRAATDGTDDLYKITELLANAGTSAGLGFDQLVSGVDSLATGTVAANSDLGRFLTTMGLSNEELKKAPDLVELLQEKLGAFTVGDTYTVAMSNLEVAWNKMLGSMSKDLFGWNKDVLKSLTQLINDFTAKLPEWGLKWSKFLAQMGAGWDIMIETYKSNFQAFVKWFAQILTSLSAHFKLLLAGLSKYAAEAKVIYEKSKDFFGLGDSAALNKAKSGVNELTSYMKDLNSTIDAAPDIELDFSVKSAGLVQAELYMENMTAEFNKSIAEAANKASETATAKTTPKPKPVETLEKIEKASKKVKKKVETDMDKLSESIESSLSGAMTSTFRSWMDGAVDWKDAMGNILKDILAQIFELTVAKQAAEAGSSLLSSGISAAFGFSKGGVINPTEKYAKGGIVSSPTTFAGGTGLMGEAGPEAIMPVSRTSSGDLGVSVSQSPVNVSVNNYGNDQVQVSTSDDGTVQITIAQIVDDINRGTGPVGTAIESRYNLRKA